GWGEEHGLVFEDGVDVIASEYGDQVPDDAVASNGDSGARLHNVYPLLYNRCVVDATARFAEPQDGAALLSRRARRGGGRGTGRRSSGAARAGRAASVIRSALAARRRATGKASPRRSAA